MTDLRTTPLRMAPDLRVRPWAGARLAPAADRIGEAWLAGPASRVLDGPAAGRTLDDLAAAMGTDLVGTRGLVHGRGGFPLLIKLIDADQWLSVQVHPDDAQAFAIEGEPGIGKSESWLVLDAGADAAILLGPAPDVEPEAVLTALGTDALPDVLARVEVAPGDRIGVPAGTLHAIGPGVFVYEIQQPCDITYRAWDWGRTDRTVHTQQSRAVTDPTARGTFHRSHHGEHAGVVASSLYFRALQVVLGGSGSAATTDGRSPHVVTIVAGAAELTTAAGAVHLSPYDTVVLPATMGEYRLDAAGYARAVVATVP